MKIFILEDNKERIDTFKAVFDGHDLTIAMDIQDAGDFKPPYDLICLDHDLGGQVFVPSAAFNTGYSFVCGLTPEDVEGAVVLVHSWNPDGAKAMTDELHRRNAFVIQRQFGFGVIRDALEFTQGSLDRRAASTIQNA